MSSATDQIFRADSPEQTIQFGARLAAQLRPPQLLLLVGNLGAGKTTLAKGIISGLGVAPPEDVLSPTFSLIHEYEGPPKVYHIDLYRLDRLPELETLGLEDLWDQSAIVIIEWGEKFSSQLPRPRTEIHLRDLEGDAREFRILHIPVEA